MGPISVASAPNSCYIWLFKTWKYYFDILLKKMEFLKSMSTRDLRTINSVMCGGGGSTGWPSYGVAVFSQRLKYNWYNFLFFFSYNPSNSLFSAYPRPTNIDCANFWSSYSQITYSEALVLIHAALYFFPPPSLSLFTFCYVHGSIAWCKMYQCGKKYYLYNGLFSHILKYHLLWVLSSSL